MINRKPDPFDILISTGLRFDRTDRWVPSHVVFLRPITPRPMQAATHEIKPAQNIISKDFKRALLIPTQILVEGNCLIPEQNSVQGY